MNATSFEDLAAQLVAALAAGKNAEVRARFDAAMSKAIATDDAVAAMWASLEGAAGKFQKLVETKGSEKDGYHIVLATCVFEKSPMDLRFVFDQQRHIAGFFMIPTTNPNAYGPRPQQPKPPFPYQAREVAFDSTKDEHNDNMHFAGTLTLPPGAGPFPAVLLITGSGTQDRDETIFGHKPFLLIADRLTRSGIAVLRVDDPGAGGSTGNVSAATLESHARDVEAGVAFLKAQKEIDPQRIGLIGHSEGGVLAAMVASRSKDVALVVSLAGTGLSGAEINPMQAEASLRADGKTSEEGIKAIVAAQRKIMKLVAAHGDDATLTAAIKEAVEIATKYASDQGDAAAKAKMQAEMQAKMTGSLAMLKLPWFASFVSLDPARYWAKVTVPVLAMNGDKDTQVPAEANLAAIKAAMVKAKNGDFTELKLASLNHLFQPAKTGLVDEYAKIETTFDDAALERLRGWLVQHTDGKTSGEEPKTTNAETPGAKTTTTAKTAETKE